MDLTRPRINITETELRDALVDALARTGVRSLDTDDIRQLADELVDAVRHIDPR